ncbi:MAG: hypothetical protein GX123_01285, partial [Clostridiales bacterium]|nr:hypothetical protein [Clostridiales bacterium]
MYNADRLTAKRGGALALALLILLLPVMGLAQPAPDPLTITAAWTGTDGTPQTAQSVAVIYPQYPNSYWLYVPQEAVSLDASLSITDNYAAYPGGFNLPQGQLLSQLGYVDAGTVLNDMPVFFQGLDAMGQPVADFMLFISTVAPTPEPPPEVTAEPTPVPPATVSVRYLDQSSMADLMGATTQ